MKTFIQWCEHYKCNPDTPEAQADYQRYREQLELFQSVPVEPCFLDDGEPLEPPTFINRPGPSVLVALYYIQSEKGYWRPHGAGYTDDLAEAGRFSLDDMQAINLDQCTLHRVRD